MPSPDRLSLAHLPTPLMAVPAPSLFGSARHPLWIKRDDLTGFALSGNKVRKLEYLLRAAQKADANHLITCGGVNSNHARATAFAARRLGGHASLLLRGEDRDPPTGNLLLDRLLDANVRFIDETEWAERDARMAAWADEIRSPEVRPYVIPEGGSNALGCLGYAAAFGEFRSQWTQPGPLRIVHAVGSGGTTAGLALGAAEHLDLQVDIVGVAVCDDAPYFEARIEAILDDVVAQGWTTAEVRNRARFRIIDRYRGPKYGESSETALRAQLRFIRQTGILVDPVYTGKAIHALLDEGPGWLDEMPVVFWHTGGGFEIFAQAATYAAL